MSARTLLAALIAVATVALVIGTALERGEAHHSDAAASAEHAHDEASGGSTESAGHRAAESRDAPTGRVTGLVALALAAVVAGSVALVGLRARLAGGDRRLDARYHIAEVM